MKTMSDLLYYSVFSRPEKVSMAKAIILWAGIKVPQPRAVAKQYWKDCPLYELDTIWDFFVLVQKLFQDKDNVICADFQLGIYRLNQQQ